jgi:hypothetical protein
MTPLHVKDELKLFQGDAGVATRHETMRAYANAILFEFGVLLVQIKLLLPLLIG